MSHELIDWDTLALVKKAAPQVTLVAFDMACCVVRGMMDFGKANKCSMDQFGQKFWQTTVGDLHTYCKFGTEVSINLVGRACHDMGLESWRKTDGFHVAWSETQLSILKKFFKA